MASTVPLIAQPKDDKDKEDEEEEKTKGKKGKGKAQDDDDDDEKDDDAKAARAASAAASPRSSISDRSRPPAARSEVRSEHQRAGQRSHHAPRAMFEGQAPEGSEAKDSIRQRMATVENPDVGADAPPPPNARDPKVIADLIIRAGQKRRGEKVTGIVE